jgi:hypothetical protein
MNEKERKPDFFDNPFPEFRETSAWRILLEIIGWAPAGTRFGFWGEPSSPPSSRLRQNFGLKDFL